MNAPAINTTINTILDSIVNPGVYLLFAVAMAYFLWGVYKYVASADNPEARTQGQWHILYGVVGLAIMISAFGIVRFVINSVNPPAAQRPTSIPQ